MKTENRENFKLTPYLIVEMPVNTFIKTILQNLTIICWWYWILFSCVCVNRSVSFSNSCFSLFRKIAVSLCLEEQPIVVLSIKTFSIPCSNWRWLVISSTKQLLTAFAAFLTLSFRSKLLYICSSKVAGFLSML